MKQYFIYFEFDYYCQGVEKGNAQALVNANTYKEACDKISHSLEQVTELPNPKKARNFRNLTIL